MGAIGLAATEKRRRSIMCFAFVCSIISWTCMILSALGMSLSPTFLINFSWAGAKYELLRPDGTVLDMNAVSYFGITGRMVEYNGIHRLNNTHAIAAHAMRNDLHGPWSWSSVACSSETGLLSAVGQDLVKGCAACAAAATETQSFIVSSCITMLFQVVTDLQRLTRYGDVNCQKSFGTFTSLLGLATGLLSLRSYNSGCVAKMPRETTFRGGVLNPMLTIRLTNYPGTGFYLMLVGTLFKLIDVVAHLLLPTPRPKRQPLAGRVSLVEYLKTAVAEEPTSTTKTIMEYSIATKDDKAEEHRKG